MAIGWLITLWDIGKAVIKKKSPSGQDLIATDLKVIQEIYRSAILDLKNELAEQKGLIERHRTKHPDNGIELDEWHRREEKLMQDKLNLLKQIMDLKGQLLFAMKEIERVQKNKNKLP